jgi:hypothetical protein
MGNDHGPMADQLHAHALGMLAEAVVVARRRLDRGDDATTIAVEAGYNLDVGPFSGEVSRTVLATALGAAIVELARA